MMALGFGGYTIVNLGQVPGVTLPYGGLVISPANTNTLYLGGGSDQTNAQVFSYTVTRDAKGHILPFASSSMGSALSVTPANSPNGGIDGGLLVAPNNSTLLWTAFPDDLLGQFNGSTRTSVDLSKLGIGMADFNHSVGAMAFVPATFPGAGNLMIDTSGADNTVYSTSLTPRMDGSGFYDVAAPTASQALNHGGNQPEGLGYVSGSTPGFATLGATMGATPGAALLVAQFQGGEVGGQIQAYPIDSNGLPIITTSLGANADLPFARGFDSPQGLTIDPVTGDILVTDYNINHSNESLVYEIQAPTSATSTPEPSSLWLTAIGMAGLLGYGWRRWTVTNSIPNDE
jgi:hypothetical protein